MLDVRPNRVHREGSLRHPKGSIGEDFGPLLGAVLGTQIGLKGDLFRAV